MDLLTNLLFFATILNISSLQVSTSGINGHAARERMLFQAGGMPFTARLNKSKSGSRGSLDEQVAASVSLNNWL